MTIDVERIKVLIGWARSKAGQTVHAIEQQGFLDMAALMEAHLATLPREVPVEAWGVVLHGSPSGLYVVRVSENEMRTWARDRLAGDGYSFVRLTGVAVIPPAVK